MSNATSIVEERALKLLGDGLAPEIVAMAVGVTASRISQLISDPDFASRVSDLRYKNLSKHAERDEKYDNIEDKLLDRMELMLPMMFKPTEVLRALTAVNMAKRRAPAVPESMIGQKEVVTLTMPQVVLNQFNQQFITNVNNQVIKAGDQELVTVQSVRMNELLRERKTQIVQERVKTLLDSQSAKNHASHTVIDANTGALESR